MERIPPAEVRNVDYCRCRRWDGSPAHKALQRAWAVRRSDVAPWETSAILGASPEDRMGHCMFMVYDMTSPHLASVAFAAWSQRMLGDEPARNRRYTFCAPLMAAAASLCMSDLYTDAVAHTSPSDVYNTLKFAEALAMQAFTLGSRCSDGAAPLRLFSRLEAYVNYGAWLSRYGSRALDAYKWYHLDGAQTARLGATVCPEDTIEPLPAPSDGPSVECLVPAAWPEELELMVEIAGTWAQDCDACVFFVAARPDVEPPPTAIGACSVVDIAEGPLVDEPRGYLANGAKLQKVWFRGLQSQKHDWACFADADVHLAVPNFRRLVKRRRLSPTGVHWLGFTISSSLLQEGLQVEPTGGSCVSRGASLQFRSRFPGSPPDESLLVPEWPPAIHPCRKVPIPQKTGLTMSTVTACMAAAGIYSADIALTHDARGRQLYLNLHPLGDNLLEDPTLRPPITPFLITDHDQLNHTRMIWKGKEPLYYLCGNTRWVGYYPVMFHGHITHSPRYMQHFIGSYKEHKKRWMLQYPSHREVYELLKKSEWRLGDNLREALLGVFAATRSSSA